MHIWTIRKWEKFYDLSNPNHRTGVRLKFDKSIDPEVRRACKEFLLWLRKEYFFPIRVPIYIKASRRIKAMDGDMVVGTFFMPDNRNDEPYIRIATGDYDELVRKWGKKNALASTLFVMAHELTHYFQWINDITLTPIGEERQATNYSNFIVWDYAETREHP